LASVSARGDGSSRARKDDASAEAFVETEGGAPEARPAGDECL
jgi:hypothetical protein